MWRWRGKTGDEGTESARSGAAMSAVVHLALIAACILYANARPFEPRGDQTIAVDIVAPPDAGTKEVATKEAETPLSPKEPALDLKPAVQSSPAAQSAPPAPSTPPPAPRQAAAPPPAPAPVKQPPAPPQQPAAQPIPPQQAAAPPGYIAPEPDITVKYGVDFGLPGLTPGGGKDDFDSQASSAAKVEKQDIAAFRARLRSCAALPAELASDDRVRIVLRAMFTPDGRLARAPVLIEASASAKGPLLMQAAIAALESCQPYAMLPADKYDEWKILDLPFTPQDFARG